MHTVPLTSLDGKENLPIEKEITEKEAILLPVYKEGYTDAVDHLNQCTVGLDEERLEYFISEYIGYDGQYSCGAEKLAKAIASKPELFIKIGRK